MLVRCLYASRPSEPLDAATVGSILAQSLANNPRHGITGLLCFTRTVFVQVIEGGRDEVCELFTTIVRDSRHRDLRLLSYEEIAERRFFNWSMGQINLDRVNPALLLKYAQTADFDPFTMPSAATMALLNELVLSVPISNHNA